MKRQVICDDKAQGTDSEGNEDRGKFFIIDSRIWARATACGMNEAAAYLVLASGTGKDNKTTEWSTQSVMTYAGMGWNRAKDAMDGLIAAGIIRCATGYTASKPLYEMASFQELIEYETAKNPPRLLDALERALLSRLREGIQPASRAERNRAERLLQNRQLLKDAKGVYLTPELIKNDPGENLIWLPNSIVNGTSSGEESPVRRLRSAGCVRTLRLFVNLYSAHNLRDDGGISPRLIRTNFDRQMIGQQGAYIVWGFKTSEKGWGTLWEKGPFAGFEPAKPGEKAPVWVSVELLQSMGLLSFVPHIFENDTKTAEPIHSYGIAGVGEALEQEIGNAANLAARAMALPSKLTEAAEGGFEYFCPVLKTIPAVQMIGVGRLTYRPNTRRTKAWFAELHNTAPEWIQTYADLLSRADIASGRRQMNFG
jgi:hypothetical protein